jgi:hypothetical protein
VNLMQKRQVTIAISVTILAVILSLGCAVTGEGLGPLASTGPTDTPTATRTPIPYPIIDFNATALAATVRAEGGYIVTSTPLPVFPTLTSTPFDQIGFLATINAQFAQATETAQALATPTPTPTNTPPPPRILPPAGGSAPGSP